MRRTEKKKFIGELCSFDCSLFFKPFSKANRFTEKRILKKGRGKIIKHQQYEKRRMPFENNA